MTDSEQRWLDHDDSCQCHIGICAHCGCTNEVTAPLDVARLAEAINNVAKANPPHPALPISRTIPEAAAAYAAEYTRLSRR